MKLKKKMKYIIIYVKMWRTKMKEQEQEMELKWTRLTKKKGRRQRSNQILHMKSTI
jgi:hypothetical protein